MTWLLTLVLRRCLGLQMSHSFATRHDAQIWRCFSTLVGLDPDAVCHSAKITASLPLAAGGLEIRRALGELGRHHQDGE